MIAGGVINQYHSPCTALQTYIWVEMLTSASVARVRRQLHQLLNAAYVHCSFTFAVMARESLLQWATQQRS
jgi:hypothetical protein